MDKEKVESIAKELKEAKTKVDFYYNSLILYLEHNSLNDEEDKFNHKVSPMDHIAYLSKELKKHSLTLGDVLTDALSGCHQPWYM